MDRWWRWLLLSLGLLTACGIGVDSLKPGVSRVADIVHAMGPPAAVWPGENGNSVHEYPTGPAGLQTYMLTVDPDGLLLAVLPVLTESEFVRVTPGMTRDAVRRRLGRPAETRHFELSGEEVWTWRYADSHNMVMHFNAHFAPATGQLLRSTRTMEPMP